MPIRKKSDRFAQNIETARGLLDIHSDLNMHPVERIKGKRIWFSAGEAHLSAFGFFLAPAIILGVMTFIFWLEGNRRYSIGIVICICIFMGLLILALRHIGDKRSTHMLDMERGLLWVLDRREKLKERFNVEDLHIYIRTKRQHDDPKGYQGMTLTLCDPHPSEWDFRASKIPKINFYLFSTDAQSEDMALEQLQEAADSLMKLLPFKSVAVQSLFIA